MSELAANSDQGNRAARESEQTWSTDASTPGQPVLPLPSIRLAYRIDADDCLCEVNNTWRDFALENGASQTLAEGALGTVLWAHIEGDSVREIYQRLTRRARDGQPVRFSYRCDSPTARRTFEMTIQADADRRVDFHTELVRLETRPSVRLLEQLTERSAACVRVCAWCQRVATTATEWFEVEEAVNRLGLLHAERLPGITHGMCDECYRRFALLLGS